MSGSGVAEGGYVCAPYLHNENSLRLKEMLQKSDNVNGMYFATATFSEDGNAYFPSHSNTYLLARFNSVQPVLEQVSKYKQERPTFVFSRYHEFFERFSELKL